MARTQWLHITADWQPVRLPNGDVGRIRQDPWEARGVQIDDGRAAPRGWGYLYLRKAALRGYRPYVAADYPAWRYHPPTMAMQLVQSAEEAAALGPNWVASPAEYGVETHPTVERPPVGDLERQATAAVWQAAVAAQDAIDDENAAVKDLLWLTDDGAYYG